TTAPGQEGLFDAWRPHAVFVTSGFETLQAESQHRGHAIIEQLIADGAASALAHLPSGSFSANAAWPPLSPLPPNLPPPAPRAAPLAPGILLRDRGVGAAVGTRHHPPPPRRGPGRRVPRPSPHRHHPRAPDQRPSPAGPLRAPADPAPAPAMALGTGLGQPARRDPPTTRRLTDHRRRGPRPEDHSGEAAQTGGSRAPRHNTPGKRRSTIY